jgi:light-regulated signal transduction histidine kinase (bacteriophytochrome)
METFTYSVSHDLRAPLRGILGFTTILEEEYAGKLDNEARRITGIIKKNTLKMGELVDDLLTFSRMARKDLVQSAINNNEVVKEVINMDSTSQACNGRTVEWTIHPLPRVMGDAGTIRQVWINLISNAVKYSRNAPHPHIEIGSFPYNNQTAFFVKDNGVGFDAKYKDKLSTPAQ